MGERGNFLWLVQKRIKNISCILSRAFAKSSYAMPLSTHGATGTGGGKIKTSRYGGMSMNRFTVEEMNLWVLSAVLNGRNIMRRNVQPVR